MRFRRGRFRRSAGKRTVAWIDGITTFGGATDVRFRVMTLAPIVAGSPTWGVAIAMTLPTDLTEHGGEDAVLQRIRGSIALFRGRRDAGAGFAAAGYPLRVVITQEESNRALAVFPADFTTSEGLGRDSILWMHDMIVASTDPGPTGTGFDAISFDDHVRAIDVDVKAKRKLQVDRPILLWFQTVPPAGTVALEFSWSGGLRSLLARPR